MIKLFYAIVILLIAIFCISIVYKLYAKHKIRTRAALDLEKKKDVIVHKRSDSVIILLHGFSTGPQEFNSLYPYLDKKNISYVSINLDGYNEENTERLKKMKYSIWEKQVLDMYDSLVKKYKNIDVLGYSNGANLAFKLSENKEIRNLVLLNPFSTPRKDLLKLLEHSKNRFFNAFMSFFVEYLPMDPKLTRPFYQYPYVPYVSLIEILKLQSSVNFMNINARNIFLIYAKKDDLADYSLLVEDKLIGKIKPEDILVLENSSHRALEESEKYKIEKFLDKIFR